MFGIKKDPAKKKDEIMSVWDVTGVPAFQQFWDLGILPWKLMYKGFVPEWHKIAASTIKNESAKRRMSRMNTAKFVASELANLIWAEKCNIQVSQKGTDDTRLNDYIHAVFRENNFNTKIRKVIEEACALGGAAIRCYAEGKPDESGKFHYAVKFGYFAADKFIPVSWTNKGIQEAVFIDKVAKNGLYYTKLEWHLRSGQDYVIKNDLYRSESADILGVKSPLSEIYAIDPEVTLQNMDGAMFTYFSPSVANNYDDNSPLGISIYGNAEDTLKAIDVAFDSFSREFILGKKRIIVPASAIRTVRDSNGQEHRYFDSNDEVWEALYCDNAEGLKIVDNTIELRIDEHINAINALLNILSMQIGLSAGSLSFDKNQGMKTATEVISENSKTFRFIKTMQEPLVDSISGLIGTIVNLAILYDIDFDGTPVKNLVAGGYNVSIHFDDSIIEDKNADITRGMELVSRGLMSKMSFMLNVLKYTPERAEAEISLLMDENKQVADSLTYGGGFE